jgi:hypothetical protein
VDYGRKEKNRMDEPILVTVHIYMEMSQMSPCIAILNKSGEQEGKSGPEGGWRR